MPEKKHTVAIIPARGGSKAIPRKNLKLLGGKPLVAWPIELAMSIKGIDRVIVSSDDDEINTLAKEYGSEVLFKRPKQLSEDTTPTFPVVKHAIEHLITVEKYSVENVVLLYATTPFLKPKRIEEGIHLLNTTGFGSIIGVRQVHGLLWKEGKRGTFSPFYPKERANRQLYSHLYEEAGNIYLSKATVLLKQNRLIDDDNCGFIEIGDDEMLDIDTPEDFIKAEQKVKERHL